jgi:hypothetical protein
MISSGLVSVTFRRLAPATIIELAQQAGLSAIEWGGDIHVPHGDIATARQVGDATREAGLQVAAYGSYYRAGAANPIPFEAVLNTAQALGAPLVRVWAGECSSESAMPGYFETVANELAALAAMAADAGIAVATEFHGGTLADNGVATLRLLQGAAHPQLFTLWQPQPGRSAQLCRAELAILLPHLANLHVFAWLNTAAQIVRRPICEQATSWLSYLKLAATAPRAMPGGPRHALLEFVQDDAPEALAHEAATLNDWLARLPALQNTTSDENIGAH